MTKSLDMRPQAADERYRDLRNSLIDAEILFSTGVDGLYGRSQTYQSILEAIDRRIHLWATTLDAVTIHLPPVISRSTFEGTNYLQSFPDLMGSVHVFRGNDRDHAELLRRVESGGDWPALLEPAEIVLSSAACHALYPMCRGTLLPSGRRFEVEGFCFRHEPSDDPARMQAFHMHEVVYVGDPDAAEEHRDRGLEYGIGLLESLGLPMRVVPANDPFFGRLGTALAAEQLEEGLKLEGVTPICSDETPTAIMSANCHRDHFGLPFAIRTGDGAPAHSSCVAFGVDRIALGLLQLHGLAPQRWPAAVRDQLWP
jgi:seryl-tRNA synthetase